MSASTSNINALRLVAHDRKADGGTVLVRVKPESLKFTCVAAAVGMALDLLQTRPSLRALGLYTLKVADISSHIPRLRNLKNGGEVKVVQEFIAALRASFPHVLITQENGMRAKNARTNKLDCPDTFDPKKAAVLELNNKLVEMMVDACNTARTQRSPAALARFQTLLCRISITLAHELIHVFTLFLRRQKSQHTPPRFSYGGYGTDVAGEAGRYWEYQVFGGYVDMRAGSSGEAIALRGNLAGRVWRLRSQLLGRFIAGDYSWLDEQLTESDHSYYREATDVMDAHKWVQRYADIFPQESPRKNSKQELSPSEVRELVELRSPQFPMFRISRGDLRRFIQNPALPVSASAA